jgi:hypothetical protein
MNSKTKFFCVSLIAILFAFKINAQTFMKTYPTTFDKTSRDIVYTGDGYIIVGMTNNSDITDCDLYIMKTDLNGNMLWQKIYGGARPDYPYSLCETSDGNFFVTGFTQSFGPGDYDVYLIKFDGNGEKIWEKTYAGWGNDEAREIIKTSDNNYMIAGTSSSTNWTSNQNAFLMKIDVNGDVIWRKFYGGPAKEYGNGVKECSDGGFILTGQTFSFGQGGNTYLVKTNASGDTLWTRHWGGPLAEEGVSIVTHSDGSSTLAVRDSTSNQDIDVRIMKVDASGSVLFDKVYGGTMKDTPKTINKTADGGFIIGAISRSFGWINPDMWLMKFNSIGDTSWTKRYGHTDHEHCHMAKEHIDGGILAIGHARSWGPGQKIMFVKMDGNGAVSVNENLVSNSLQVTMYPNPVTTGKFAIAASSLTNCKVSVKDISGRCVYLLESIQLKPQEEVFIQTSNFSNGLYFVTLESDKGIVTEKFIIN